MTAELNDIFARATATENDPSPTPKAVLVFAHSDDETIAVGGRLKRFGAAHFIHVTDSAPRNEEDSRAHGFRSWQEYRQARAEELRRALDTAGLFHATWECFDIPDQEASLNLPGLVSRLYSVLERQRPEVVFTHPYEGGHPDHDACAFAVQHAVALLSVEKQPLIIEAPFYHAGPQGIETGSFLPAEPETQEVVRPLSIEERQSKQAALACFITQRDILRSFAVECERFRIAPRYNFRTRPHDGTVFYERFPWGMTAERFCELARDAEDSGETGVRTCR
jgi:N-acetylglucosamine malate deacetylase 2